jgi:cysteine-rich repeat protein
MVRGLLVAVILAGILASPVSSRPAPRVIDPACSHGRWNVVSGGSGADAVILAPGGVSVGSSCPPGKGRLRAARSRTKLTAQLPRCPGLRGAAQLTASFQNDCDTLTGSIRLRRGGAPRSLVAHRQWCGDGTRDASHGDDCDGSDLGGQTCESLHYASGSLRCTDACKLDKSGCVPVHTPSCPDGILDPGEQCDGSVPAGITCESLQYAGGTIGCTTDCHLDLSHCLLNLPAVCGNGRRDPGETCDGDDLGGAVCPHGGTLRCQPGCLALDTSACLTCGDGQRNAGEACDGADLGGATCQSLGDAGGPLGCDSRCRFDRSGCFRCGNGRVDPGEECDDGNTVSGDGCSATCTSECGDGVVERGEECDDGNRTDGDGCTSLCALEHTYGGGGGEAYDSCLLDWGVQGSASGALLGCDDGSAPCQRDATGDCTFTVFYCFNASPLVGNTPACLPTGIAHVEIDAGSVLDPATENAILDAFTTTLTRWGGASVTRTGLALDAAPPASIPRICGGFALPVSSGEQRIVAVSVRDTLAPPRVDADQLTFVCAPP